ncbi:coagulation [Bonamia ostreae]|uniref:Coagulation n=1 Tax=Bonamia ostreae TaxID=126728 RepID=A0ABV2ATZ0_9EUKA
MYPRNGYSTSTGIFRCTKHGLYIFLVNVESNTQLLTAYIQVNYSRKTEIRSDGRRGGYDCTSAVAVLELNYGDEVSVYLTTGTADEGQTMFNGYLLHPL